MDPELRALLTALTEGQVNLAQGQAELAQSQAKLAESMANLAERTGNLEVAMKETREDIKAFATRMEMYTQAVLRGFTAAADGDGGLQAQIDALAARVVALEKGGPPGRGPKARKPRASRSK